MTVGRVSNMNTMYYINAAGRVNSPAKRAAAQTVQSVAPQERPPGNRPGMIYSLDGDSAEISKRARNMSDAGREPRTGGPGIITNYRFDLPSPLIDWGRLDFGPNIIPAGSAPPQNPLPAEIPSGGQFPVVIESGLLEELKPEGECNTCANRKYVDQSDDPSVSFQTPTNISANMSAAAVASHEAEHVRNEQAKAHREDREIVSQTVTLTYDCCPECGKNYVSGGTTRTTSVSKSDSGTDSGTDTGNDNSD